MKNLNDLTIKEYNDYATLLDEGKADGNVIYFQLWKYLILKILINLIIMIFKKNGIKLKVCH